MWKLLNQNLQRESFKEQKLKDQSHSLFGTKTNQANLIDPMNIKVQNEYMILIGKTQ